MAQFYRVLGRAYDRQPQSADAFGVAEQVIMMIRKNKMLLWFQP